MAFSEKDKELIEKCLKDKSYTISVDNDSISVSRYDEILDDNDYIGSFDCYGSDFTVNLLKFIGANADFC